MLKERVQGIMASMRRGLHWLAPCGSAEANINNTAIIKFVIFIFEVRPEVDPTHPI